MAKDASDQAESGVVDELRAEADKLFPGAVREVALLRHGDDPVVEPGELLVRIIATEQADAGEPKRPDPPRKELMDQFQRLVARRLPAVRRMEVISGDPAAEHRSKMVLRVRGEDGRPPVDADLTPVMVRMRAGELEIVDTLISAGIAPNRAEAVRWALNRISERPAYGQLRERTREIEQLKSQF
jgi:hypothetical protein